MPTLEVQDHCSGGNGASVCRCLLIHMFRSVNTVSFNINNASTHRSSQTLFQIHIHVSSEQCSYIYRLLHTQLLTEQEALHNTAARQSQCYRGVHFWLRNMTDRMLKKTFNLSSRSNEKVVRFHLFIKQDM